LRAYPHKPLAPIFQQNLAAAIEELVRHNDVTPALLAERTDRFFPLNARWGMECATRGYALEMAKEDILRFFAESSWSFGKAIETNASIHVGEVAKHLSVALVLRLEKTIERLANLPRDRYAKSKVEFPECVFLAEEAQAHIVMGRMGAAQNSLKAGFAQVGEKGLPADVREDVEPVLLIEKAILDGDGEGLHTGFALRQKGFIKRFSNPRVRNMAEGAMDVWALGLARMALDRKLAITHQSVYVPLELLGA
jgi:hypothetical protein